MVFEFVPSSVCLISIRLARSKHAILTRISSVLRLRYACKDGALLNNFCSITLAKHFAWSGDLTRKFFCAMIPVTLRFLLDKLNHETLYQIIIDRRLEIWLPLWTHIIELRKARLFSTSCLSSRSSFCWGNLSLSIVLSILIMSAVFVVFGHNFTA